MHTDINKIWVFRIIPLANLKIILANGMYSKLSGKNDAGFINIGSAEIISERDNRTVKCFPNTVVNQYVPFYFSVRTPMLYNIITGHSVPAYPQQEIIYLCCKVSDLATDDFTWCYTDGNAAKKITKFGTKLDLLVSMLDWKSILSTDFRDDNADGDEDRIRKKHSEFLVKDYVPTVFIKRIVVLNQTKKSEVENLLESLNICNIEVHINPDNRFFF